MGMLIASNNLRRHDILTQSDHKATRPRRCRGLPICTYSIVQKGYNAVSFALLLEPYMMLSGEVQVTHVEVRLLATVAV